MEFYSDNTLTHYVTKLPQRIHLKGEWEVGLTDIHYPHSWYNLRGAEILLVKNKGSKTFHIENGYYESTEKLVDTINDLVKTEFHEESVHLSYNPVNQHVSVKVVAPWRFLPNTHMGNVLGFGAQQTSFDGGTNYETYRGEHVAALNQGIYGLFVYSDIVEPQTVGDRLVPLLRTVPITGRHGENVATYFQNVHYVNLLRKEFDMVEIDIRDDTGQPIPFEQGKLMLTLHFRKKQLLL